MSKRRRVSFSSIKIILFCRDDNNKKKEGADRDQEERGGKAWATAKGRKLGSNEKRV